MSVLPAEVRSRLAKIAGRLGSNHDGERAAAALLASNLLRQHGATWDDAVNPPLLAAPSPPPRGPVRRWQDGLSGGALALRCLMWPEVLTPWESEFCRSVSGRRSLTLRQAAALEKIATKVRNFAMAGGGR